jgi:O-antigen/teichoic acid export membrane protein
VNSTDNIKTGALISYIGILLNIIAGLIYTPWMIKQIGASDYGLYALTTTIIGYFLLDFGLGNSISRFISKYRAEDRPEDISNFLGIVYKLYLFISIIIVIFLVVIYLLIGKIFLELTALEIDRLKVVYIIAGFFSVVSFPFNTLNGILISYEKFVPLKLSEIMQKIITIVIMVIALLCGKGLYTLVIVNGIVGVIVICYKFFVIKKYININVNWKYKNKALIIGILSFSLWITVVGIADQLIINFPTIALGAFSGTSAITIYALGRMIHGYVWTFGYAINGLFMPKVSKICLREDRKDQLEQLMIKVGRIQLLVIGCIISGFIVLGKEFVYLWMGNGFEDLYWISILLILPHIVILTEEIANSAMFFDNVVKYKAVVYIMSSIVSVTISCIFARKLGAIGASIGVFIGYIIFNIFVLNVVYYKKMDIDIINFFKKCHLKILPYIFCIILIGALINKFFIAAQWSLLGLKGCAFVLIYVVINWLFTMNNEEKEIINGVINALLRRRTN